VLWIKTFHIIFIASWFSGLFYLPRIYVNLAMLEDSDQVTKSRLITMSDKLLKFMTLLSIPSLVLGLILWQMYGIGASSDSGWMHLKLLLVMMVIGYHAYCFKLLRDFKEDNNHHSHLWYRWFNEMPVILMVYIVALIVNKPTDLMSFLLNLTAYFMLAILGFFAINFVINKKRIKQK